LKRAFLGFCRRKSAFGGQGRLPGMRREGPAFAHGPRRCDEEGTASAAKRCVMRFRQSGAGSIEAELEYSFHEMRITIATTAAGESILRCCERRVTGMGFSGMRERAGESARGLKYGAASPAETEVERQSPPYLFGSSQNGSRASNRLSRLYARRKVPGPSESRR